MNKNDYEELFDKYEQIEEKIGNLETTIMFIIKHFPKSDVKFDFKIGDNPFFGKDNIKPTIENCQASKERMAKYFQDSNQKL